MAGQNDSEYNDTLPRAFFTNPMESLLCITSQSHLMKVKFSLELKETIAGVDFNVPVQAVLQVEATTVSYPIRIDIYLRHIWRFTAESYHAYMDTGSASPLVRAYVIYSSYIKYNIK